MAENADGIRNSFRTTLVTSMVAILYLSLSNVACQRGSKVEPATIPTKQELGPYQIPVGEPRYTVLDVEAILEDLASGDWKVQLRATDVIPQSRHQSPLFHAVIPTLSTSLSSPHSEVRSSAARALKSLANNANDQRVRLPTLEPGLDAILLKLAENSTPEQIRRELIGVAREIAANLGHHSIELTISIFTELLNGASDDLAETIYFSLELFGRDAYSAVPAIVQQLSTDDIKESDVDSLWRSKHAIDALFKIGCDPTICANASIDLIKRILANPPTERDPLEFVVRDLPRFGNTAKPAVPILIPLLRRDDLGLRHRTALAIRQLADRKSDEFAIATEYFDSVAELDYLSDDMYREQEDTVFRNTEVLRDIQNTDVAIRMRALDVFSSIYHWFPVAEATAFRPAIPELIESLKSDNPGLNRSAVRALGAIAESGLLQKVRIEELEPAVSAIRNSLKSSSEELRSVSARCLGRIALSAESDLIEEVVADLIAATDDSSWQVVSSAIRSLGEMEAHAIPAVPAIIKNLEGPAFMESARALARLKLRPDLSVPALTTALDNERVSERRTPCYFETDPANEYMDALAAFGEDAREAVPTLIPIISSFNSYRALQALLRIGPTELAVEKLDAEYRSGEGSKRTRALILSALAIAGPKGRSRAIELFSEIETFRMPGDFEKQFEVLKLLADNIKGPGLLGLDLSSSKLVDQQMETVAQMSNLQKIHLPSTVSDSGLQFFSALGNSNLRRLFIGEKISESSWRYFKSNISDFESPIGDAGLQSICRLHELEELSIPFSEITDSGLGEIQSLSNLRYLYLGSESLTIEGLNSLSELKNLTILGLRTPLIDYKELQTFLQQNPQIKKVWFDESSR